MNKPNVLFIAAIILVLSFGSRAQVVQDAMKIVNQGGARLTEKDAVAGIKEALVKGTGESVALVS